MTKKYFQIELGHTASIYFEYVSPPVEFQRMVLSGTRPIDEVIPGKMYWKGPLGVDTARRKMGGIFKIGGGLRIATRAMKDVLSRRDLGECEFFPVALYDHALTQAEDGEYFLMYIAAIADAIDIEASKGLRMTNEKLNRWQFRGDPKDRLPVVRGDHVRSVDAFIDSRFSRTYFVSEEFKQALKDPSLTVRRPQFWKCKTI